MKDPVVYQVYPRSFQDSDGDGVGDLPGIEARLGHLEWLGVDALWLSPIYPSPMADFGYDVADLEGVDPVFGTLADFDSLARAAHARGLKLLLDLVPCHTSIEHRWFRERPDFYTWADKPPNNWRATFGGPAWTQWEDGRYYLHSFYPEQPDLDWRNPAVHEAVGHAVRFWVERGADGFRLDAIDRLSKDPEFRDDPPATPRLGLPEDGEFPHSRNGPGIEAAVRSLREATGPETWLVGEVFLKAAARSAYLEHLDAAFAFELFFAGWDPAALRAGIDAELAAGKPAWVLSNHDFPRLPDRYGPGTERLAATLLLTLPGAAFVYQGDEIGMRDGPGHDPPYDRAGRDPFRHPMQWDPSPAGGFTQGEPWLAQVDPAARNVADQREDSGSLMHHYRELIALRRELGEGFEWLPSGPHVLAYRRGETTITLDFETGLSTTG